MEIILGILIGMFISISAVLFYKEHKKSMAKIESENAKLVESVHAMEVRITKFEQASRKRMPYESFDETLDAMAALDVLESAEDFRQTLIQNARAHLIKSMSVGTKREDK